MASIEVHHNIINQIMYCIYFTMYCFKTMSPKPNFEQCNIIKSICSIKYLLNQPFDEKLSIQKRVLISLLLLTLYSGVDRGASPSQQQPRLRRQRRLGTGWSHGRFLPNRAQSPFQLQQLRQPQAEREPQEHRVYKPRRADERHECERAQPAQQYGADRESV